MKRSRSQFRVRCAATLFVLGVATSAFAVDAVLRKQAKDQDGVKRADAAKLLARDGSPEAAGVLADLLADKSAYVRDLTTLFCADLKDAAAIAVIGALASAKDELTRRNAASALGRTKSEAALPFLEKLAAKDSSRLVRSDALDALWLFDKSETALAIAVAALNDSDARVRAAAIEAVARIGTDAAPGIVQRFVDDKDEGVRLVARMECRFVARDVALAHALEWAKDPSWRVRAQIVEDAGWMRDAPAMEALVLLVGDPVARVSCAAHRALGQLTGKDVPRDGELWQAWWAANKATWTPPHGKLAARDDVPDAKATVAKFYGVDVASTRVAFVIDASASMRDPISKGDSRVRWDVAKKEFLDMVNALDGGYMSNLVLFGATAKASFPRAQAVSKKTRDDMVSALGVNPSSLSNLLEGVLLALDDDEIDTVFLLSDGSPSAGDMTVRERVRWAIRQHNRTRKIAIHTIGFGAVSAQERTFLADIARDSGGRCVYR